jgi:hypothetical protein
VSTAKLKQTVDVMTPAERAFVGAYLQHLARADDPTHKAKLGMRMRRMDGGRKVSLEQARHLHRALKAEKL